ncbi:DUF2163 domain-containing protein [Roseibium aquae]|uniref:DUF2163 domain-containing protein n=1 Tax=Roseibium aquae TaxID=1323746 RepID=UPI00123D3361|nr:DUF2163 domain-containing protein [Roseibium aquae]
MKPVPPAMQADLDGRATTHCRCWQVTRKDGAVFGFTDHDRALAFGGVTFEAASGFTASALETSLGLAVDNLDVEGALSSAAITEDDLARGLWDDAAVALWRVDWQDVTKRVLLRSGNIGEVARGRTAFTAELRGLSHRLGQPAGRLFSRTCAWELGDARCRVDLAPWTFAGEVAGVVAGAGAGAGERRSFTATGLEAAAPGLLAAGLLTWTSGANAGQAIEVKRHAAPGGTVTLELVLPMADPIAPGDGFMVRAGCDKAVATCRDRFANLTNFGGFPHMPGNDRIIAYADKDDLNDGGSLFR